MERRPSSTAFQWSRCELWAIKHFHGKRRTEENANGDERDDGALQKEHLAQERQRISPCVVHEEAHMRISGGEQRLQHVEHGADQFVAGGEVAARHVPRNEREQHDIARRINVHGRCRHEYAPAFLHARKDRSGRHAHEVELAPEVQVSADGDARTQRHQRIDQHSNEHVVTMTYEQIHRGNGKRAAGKDERAFRSDVRRSAAANALAYALLASGARRVEEDRQHKHGHARQNWTASARRVYFGLLDDWNRQDAASMTARFAERGSLVGFDGSAIDGRACIEAHLKPIFAQHPTPLVAKMRADGGRSDPAAARRSGNVAARRTAA